MAPLDFSSIPNNDPGDTTPGASDDTPPYALTCETCGAPLYYSGRGRKPRFCDAHKTSRASGGSSRGKTSDRELEQACSTLADLYDVTALPLALLSPDAAAVWVQQIDGLNSRNRTILANNRDLVRKINSAGAKGGTTAFVLSHLFAVAPVGFVLVGVASQGRAARAARREQEARTTYTAEQTFQDGPPPEWMQDTIRDPAEQEADGFDLDGEVFRK